MEKSTRIYKDKVRKEVVIQTRYKPPETNGKKTDHFKAYFGLNSAKTINKYG